jgi:hypothetical protein
MEFTSAPVKTWERGICSMGSKKTERKEEVMKQRNVLGRDRGDWLGRRDPPPPGIQRIVK